MKEKIGNMIKYQKHIPLSCGMYLYCTFDSNLSFYDSFTGLNCVEWFRNKLEFIAQDLERRIKHVEPIKKRINSTPSFCHICEKPFTPNDEIVLDHNHFTGDVRGYAHKNCNLQYKKSFCVPIVFHNLTGYDSHFIIRELGKTSHMHILPQNLEKYICFTQYDGNTNIRFRFIDSFRFMGSSLETLVSFLPLDEFKELKRAYRNLSDDHFKLLTRKGVFPYDYIDDVAKLSETKLPTMENFYNKLNYEDISEENYKHAQTVWNAFNCRTINDYLELYLKTDILLLSDVFNNFRKTCMKEYGLEPVWYVSLPAFGWDCLLKITQCRLQILKDIDTILFLEHGIRGGISQCSKRYTKANNKYMSNYDNTKSDIYLLYLDKNNLYGWAMSQYLPIDEFEWVDSNIDITMIDDDSDVGYILEVDIDYPENLHLLHKDLPFCPETCCPPKAKLSKLLTTFYPKKNYVIHYRNLKQALRNGLVLTKIHRCLKFKQLPWMKPYIDKNTLLRANSKNEFEKNLFKLMNNACFGKTMENIRKHRNVKLASKWLGRYGAKNLLCSPLFKQRTILDENLIVVELSKKKLLFNKPIYVGQAILDISKVNMYDFHYDYMLNHFNDLDLNYIDTDGLIYEIRGCDPYEIIKRDCNEYFDTSNYPLNNVYHIPLVNNKRLGFMKDENSGKIMIEYVGLKSKMYSFLIDGEEDKCVKKIKGIKKAVVQKYLFFADYLDCLEKGIEKIVSQNNIISKAHHIFSVNQTKVALRNDDDKRIILPDGIHTLPWGTSKEILNLYQ